VAARLRPNNRSKIQESQAEEVEQRENSHQKMKIKGAMMMNKWKNHQRKKAVTISIRIGATSAVKQEVCCAVMGVLKSHIWHA
jgi:hypothetical protein